MAQRSIGSWPSGSLPITHRSFLDSDNNPMSSTSQTVRSFAIGFVLGAIAIAVTVGQDRVPNLSDQVFPAAIAAPAN
jgi:hypothetical protein